MNDVDRVMGGLDEVGKLLDAPTLEPDPSRKDWDDHRQALSNVTARLETEVLGPLSSTAAQLGEQERVQVQLNAAFLTAEAAALSFAAGRLDEASSLIGRALTLATGDPELEAGMADLHGYTLLTRARWLYRHKKTGASDRAFRRAAKEAQHEVLKQAAERGYDAPRPISSAPPLFRINGCGFALYGARDHWPDGSHVATYCLSLLFIPIFPLTAYRIVDHGDNSYAFLAKERLSGFARGYRNLLFACIALFFVGTGVVGYLENPSRKAGIAMEEAQALEQSGDRAGALARYADVVRDYGWSASEAGQEAAEAIIRLEAAGAPKPFGPENLSVAKALVARFKAFPASAQAGAAGEALGAQLSTWAAEIGTADTKRARAALEVLDLADGTSPIVVSYVAPERSRIRTALADALAGAWPIPALELYLDAGNDEKAGAVIRKMAEHPSVLFASRAQVEAWLQHNDDQAVRWALDAASKWDQDEERRTLLAGGKRKALVRYLKKHPRDQEVAAALAAVQRNRGQPKKAMRTLSSLGAPGWLIPQAQHQLAALHMDLGELKEAEAILDPYLSARLPRFAAARHRYTTAVKDFQDRHINQARYGTLPPDLQSRLSGTSKDEQAKIFVEWLQEKEARDPKLLALRTEYQSYGDVVPASVTLGMVKLRRANEVSGTERARLLSEAESVFLSIRAEAEGLPTYHLGLGQVFHRLGRPEDGDKELQGVIAQNDPLLTMAVARVYRELGLIKRARDVCEKVFETGYGDAKTEAALLLSIMAGTLEEEEAWLVKAGTKDKYIKNRLNEVKARRLFSEGKLGQADKLFARVAAVYERQAAHSSAAANNAAINHQRRFLCTGDERLLKKAVAGLEGALRLEPDNALVVGNLAYQYQYQGQIEVLGRWIDTSILALDAQDAGTVLGAMAHGGLRDKVVEAIQENGSFRRSMDLSRQEEVLAPERTDAYVRTLAQAGLLRDRKLLKDLRNRLQHVKRLDTTHADEAMAAYKEGAQDEKLLTSTKAALRRLDDALRRAKRKRHKPTIAAIELLRGGVFEARLPVTHDVKEAAQAASAYARAERAWPAIGARNKRVWALVRIAILRAQESEPALATAWHEGSRDLGTSLTLYRALDGKDGEEIAAALRGQASLREAVELASSLPDRELRSAEWILAKVAGDADLMRRASSAFARPTDRLELEIGMALNPHSRALVVTKELFESAGQG